MRVRVREPVVQDAEALGRIHVRAWRIAYRGLMPTGSLDSLSEVARASMWRRWLLHPPRPRHARLVAETADAQIVGFILVGPCGGELDSDVGEVDAINVDPAFWAEGVGTALLRAGTARLADAGFSSAVLWVHPDNSRARGFYTGRGWAHDGQDRTQDVLGVHVRETRYSVPIA